mgnify:CR=1 FL=1
MHETIGKPAPPFKMFVVGTLVLYLALVFFTVLAGLTQGLVAGANGNSEHPFDNISPIAVICALLALVCAVGMAVVYGINLYRMWGTVQDGKASLTPGTAVVISLVPGVMLVGCFFAFHGLSKEMNRVGGSRGGPAVSEGWALTACILMVVGAVLGCIPFVGGCIGGPLQIVAIVFWVMSMFQMARTAEWLVQNPAV